MQRHFLAFAAMTALASVVLQPQATARPIDFDAGHWRLELQGAGAVHSSKTDREGDYYVTASVEYESPWLRHVAFGIRAYPLFLYPEPQPIYGAALGLVFRFYRDPSMDKGWYAEAGVAPMWHSRYFSDNSSRLNFLDELGIGYKFPHNPWHISAKYQHISNASIGSENAGVNSFSLGFGYTF